MLSFLLIFFLKVVVLETRLFHFWVKVVKKGCTANVSEMGICQAPGSIYTQTRMYSELHIQCPWKTHTRDGHASDIVRLLYGVLC